MKLMTDHFFCIGTMHERSGLPCQDYAYSGRANNGTHFAMVADGCSSSPDTDLGARILVHWMKHILQEFPPIFPPLWEDFNKDGGEITRRWQRDMCRYHEHVKTQALDATLIAALYRTDMAQAYVTIMGDGFVAIKFKTGAISLVKIDWSLNMPPYLSYHLDSLRYKALIDTYEANQGEGEMVVLNSEGEDHTQKLTIQQGLSNGGLVLSVNLDDLQSITVFSDGLGQFTNGKNIAGVKDLARMFTDVKIPGGVFVHRTCMTGLKNLKKFDIHPGDDFAAASIFFGEDEK